MRTFCANLCIALAVHSSVLVANADPRADYKPAHHHVDSVVTETPTKGATVADALPEITMAEQPADRTDRGGLFGRSPPSFQDT